MPEIKKEWMHISVCVMLFAVILSLFYLAYSANKKIEGLTASVEGLKQSINQTREELESNDALMQQNLNSQINIVAESLNQSKKESLRQMQALSGEIEESRQQIGSLEDKLKNVQVSSADFSLIVKDVVKSVVTIKTNRMEGSGFIVDEEGYVVTNWHVLDGATNAGVFTYDDNLYQVRLIAYEPAIDIAILKMVTDRNFDALVFGNSDRISVGQRVIAVGNPAGLSFSVTEGIISSAKREGLNDVDYIQIDVPINPGNSGGPLVDTGGEVIGINTLKIQGLEGVGFAIATNEIDNLVWNAIENDKADR